MHPTHDSQISGASSAETLFRDELSAQGPAGFLADPRILFEGVSVELQEVVQSSAHNENSALLEETDAAVVGETVREQGFTKCSLPAILFAIAFATLVFIGVSLRTRSGETASARSHLLRIYDICTSALPAVHNSTSAPPAMLTLQFLPDSSNAVTIDYGPDNSALRMFSPGRLVLRSVCTPSQPAPDPCLLAEQMRAHMLPRVAAVMVAQDAPQCLRTCRVQLPAPQLQCPGAKLVFQLPNTLLLPAGQPRIDILAAEFNASAEEFKLSWKGGSGAVLSLQATSFNVIVMQAPMSFTFAVMVATPQNYNFEYVRTFVAAVRNLGIPAPLYEIFITGALQHLPGDEGADLRYVCDTCSFTDKIREVFVQSKMEIVFVSHDYVIVQPDYFVGMRSFGRDWQQMQPGSIISYLGENLSVSPCPAGQYCFNRVAINFEYGAYFATQSAICAPSVCANVSYPAHSVAEDSVQRRQVVEDARRQLQLTIGYVYIPGGMRIKPDIARTGYVNGNMFVMKRQLGCCVPVRGGLNWGQGEDVEWGNQIPMRTDTAPEENPFVSVRFLKVKTFNPQWVPSFYEWLVASGNGEYVQPRRLDARFWCNGTTACA